MCRGHGGHSLPLPQRVGVTLVPGTVTRHRRRGRGGKGGSGTLKRSVETECRIDVCVWWQLSSVGKEASGTTVAWLSKEVRGKAI